MIDPFYFKLKDEYPEAFTAVDDQFQKNCPPSQPSSPLSRNARTRNPDTAAYFQCIIDAIDYVAEDLNLTVNWPQTKQELEPHMANLGNCTNLWWVAISMRIMLSKMHVTH